MSLYSQGPPAPDDRDDRSLLAAFRDGDEAAFGVLFRRHRDRLWAVALRTTGNREDAADAVQDAMISAFRKAGSYRGDAQVTTWLHRILVNACLDRLRRNQVRAADPLPDDLEEYAARGAVLASGDDAAQPEHRSLEAEQRRQLLAALELLPADQRLAIVLVDMEGYPVDEAARILECPAGTVKSRCSRGRARLSAVLDRQARDGTIRGPQPSHSRAPAAAADQSGEPTRGGGCP